MNIGLTFGSTHLDSHLHLCDHNVVFVVGRREGGSCRRRLLVVRKEKKTNAEFSARHVIEILKPKVLKKVQ